MLAWPVRRKMVMARFRRLAMTLGPLRVRTWEESSPAEGHIADPVQAVFDEPVPAQAAGELGRAGLRRCQRGDRVDGL
jgi:hypothetical protein